MERLAGREHRERRERHWREIIEKPPAASHLLVAEQGGRAVGFASLGRAFTDDSLGELYAIYVLPEAWGAGAGPALMKESLARLARDFDEAILWVLEDNPRARTFYEREGWTLTDVSREETFLETPVREAQYRIGL